MTPKARSSVRQRKHVPPRQPPGSRGKAIETSRRIEAIVQLLEQTYPGTKLALNFSTPFELLIALMLAAQCTDERVNMATAALLRKYRTP